MSLSVSSISLIFHLSLRPVLNPIIIPVRPLRKFTFHLFLSRKMTFLLCSFWKIMLFSVCNPCCFCYNWQSLPNGRNKFIHYVLGCWQHACGCSQSLSKTQWLNGHKIKDSYHTHTSAALWRVYQDSMTPCKSCSHLQPQELKMQLQGF